jgi:hypothetical protein
MNMVPWTRVFHRIISTLAPGVTSTGPRGSPVAQRVSPREPGEAFSPTTWTTPEFDAGRDGPVGVSALKHADAVAAKTARRIRGLRDRMLIDLPPM